MGIERIDRTHRQNRADAERHRGAVPHFGAGGVDHLGQPLAAPFGRRGESVPAALTPAVIGFFPARRGDDRAVLEGCTDAVTDAVERRDDFAGHAAGFRQHRLDVVHGEVAKKTFFENREEPRPKFEREAHVGEGGLIRHCFLRSGSKVSSRRGHAAFGADRIPLRYIII